MTGLDFRKLAKGMSLDDKLKLLFEDTNKQAQTQGKEYLLTHQERDSIIEDARKLNQLRYIHKAFDLFKASQFILIELDSTTLRLQLALAYLSRMFTGIWVKGCMEDVIDDLIYELAVEGYTNEQRHTKKTQDEITKKMKDIRIKYKVDRKLIQSYDYFSPPLAYKDPFSTEFKDLGVEPHPEVQEFFMLAFQMAKKVTKLLYQLECIVEEWGRNYLSTQQQEEVKEYERVLNIFVNLDSFLKPLRIYKDFDLNGVRKDNLSEPDFLKTIQNIGKALEIAEEKKEELRINVLTSD